MLDFSGIIVIMCIRPGLGCINLLLFDTDILGGMLPFNF